MMRRGLGRCQKDLGMDEPELGSSFPRLITLGQFGAQFSHLYNGDNHNNMPNCLGC